jgi:ADP-ribose pyrophosphatase
MLHSKRTFPGQKLLFHGKRYDIVDVPVKHPGGQEYHKQVIVHPGAVVILPMLDHQNIVMIRNERVAVGETLWELPAGTVEPPEPPDICAARELEEEAGYRADKVTLLTEFFSSPGICTEIMFAYLATGLEPVTQRLETGEHITPEVIALEDALEMVKNRKIKDAKTIATLLYFHSFGG